MDSRGCRIYLYDAHERTGIGPLPPAKVAKSWSVHHRYATETWLHENLKRHP